MIGDVAAEDVLQLVCNGFEQGVNLIELASRIPQVRRGFLDARVHITHPYLTKVGRLVKHLPKTTELEGASRGGRLPNRG